MRMGRTSAWRSAAVAAALLGAAACAENITTAGRCPEYCPADTLSLVDTVLTGVVVADTSVRGFSNVSDLTFLLAGNQDSLRTLAYATFQPVPQAWRTSTGDSVTLDRIDSVALEIRVDGRDTAAKDLRLLVYRAPVGLDTTTAVFGTLAAAAAGPLVDSLYTGDTLTTSMGDTLGAGTMRKLVPRAAFTPDSADSNRIALVLDARGSIPTTVTLASNQTGSAARLTYYLRGAPPFDADTFRLAYPAVPDFDTYARNPEPVVGTTTGIVVGDQPAARAFVRFDIPPSIADSVVVLRATLQLRLTGAAAGRPGEQFVVRVQPVLRYFGPKSIVLSDTSIGGAGIVTAGDTGTVVVEMARVMRFWRGTNRDSLPRVVAFRNGFEGFSLGGFSAAGSAGGTDAPRLSITYIRRFTFAVP